MKTRGLVISGDAWHPAETVRLGLAALGERSFDFEFLESSVELSLEKMLTFPVIVIAKANMVSATDVRGWLALNLQNMFQKHLQHGNGLLFVHGGSARYGELPMMRRMMGGGFLSHPPECEVALMPNTAHPLTQASNSFVVRDEHYFMEFEGAEADVFLHSSSEHGVQPAGWTRGMDGGRVCVLTPGHNLEVWLHPEFQRILSNALHWMANLD